MRVTFAVAAADGGASCGRRWSVEMDVRRTDTERQLFAAIADRLGTSAVGLSLRYATEEASHPVNLPHPSPQERCEMFGDDIPERRISDELWDVLLQLHAFSDVCEDNPEMTHTLRFIERHVAGFLLVVRTISTEATSAIEQMYLAHEERDDRVFDAFRKLAPAMQHDRDVVLAALGTGNCERLFDEGAFYQRDIEFVKRSISCSDSEYNSLYSLGVGGVSISHQLSEWRDTKEVMLHYLREVHRWSRRRLADGGCNGATYRNFQKHIRAHQWADVDIVTRVLEIDGMSLRFVTYPLTDTDADADREKHTVLIAVKECGHALQHASNRLRDTRDVVDAAIAENGEAIQHATERWRDDERCALQAVAQNGMAYLHLSDRLKLHRKLLACAAEQYPSVLAAAPRTFTTDRLFMLGACSANYKIRFGITSGWGSPDPDTEYHALQFASLSLRDDDDVVMASVSAHGNSLRFASERLRDDVGIVRAAMAHTPRAHRFASSNLRERCLAIAVLFAQSCANDDDVFEQLSYWRNHPDVVKTVIAHTRGVPNIARFDKSLLSNRDIVKCAFAHNRSRPRMSAFARPMLKYVDPILLDDPEFVAELVAENETNPKCDFSELLTCTSAQSTALRTLPTLQNLQTNRAFIMRILPQCYFIRGVPRHYLDDPEVVSAFATHHPNHPNVCDGFTDN
jgi:hypothetical protein